MFFFIALDARIVVLIVLFCLQLNFHGCLSNERYRFPDAESNERILTDNDDSKEKVRSLLEKQYSFVPDGTLAKRYKIAAEIKQNVREKKNAMDDDLSFRTSETAVRRIVGGMETSINMYPYNVAISKVDRHWCGGSIIDEQWVLTAAHCMESAHGGGDKTKLQPFVVRAGSSFHDKGGYQAKVNAVFFTENYTPGNADFDYALLRLDRPLPIGRNIAVLNLPSKDYQINKDDILIVTGWGSTDESGYGHIPNRLRFVPVPLLTQNDCQEAYRFPITDRMVCAGYATGGKDACNHDSGGPAVREGVLIGVVSFGGKRCGDPKSPGVYGKVSEITNWVEDTIIKNEAFTVPELVPRITKARHREAELERFREKIEQKRSLLRNWIKDVIQSPRFVDIAKKKILEQNSEKEPS